MNLKDKTIGLIGLASFVGIAVGLFMLLPVGWAVLLVSVLVFLSAAAALSSAG